MSLEVIVGGMSQRPRVIDGQTGISAADGRHEEAPDGRGGGDVDLPVKDDGG